MKKLSGVLVVLSLPFIVGAIIFSAAGRWDLLGLKPQRPSRDPVDVPEGLRGYEIATARAADFDALLTGEPR